MLLAPLLRRVLCDVNSHSEQVLGELSPSPARSHDQRQILQAISRTMFVMTRRQQRAGTNELKVRSGSEMNVREIIMRDPSS